MIEAVDSIPPIYGEKNPNRAFAEECLKEFVDTGLAMARVCGWPKGETADKIAAQLRSAIWRADLRNEVSITMRKQDIYLVRISDGKE